MWIIFKKEFISLFSGFIAYTVASSFVIICALFLWFFDNDFNIFNIGNASLSSFFFIAPWILLFLIPAITMRSFSEEEASGTLQWLFTQPLKLSSIVIGKYFSVLVVILFCLLSTVIFIYTLEQLVLTGQNLDFGAILSGYIGLFLVGCLFAAVGLLTSSLTKNQVIAYILALFISFILFYGFEGLSSYNLLGSSDYFVQKLGVYVHYSQLLKGVLDTRDLFYFILLIILSLMITTFNLQLKK